MIIVAMLIMYLSVNGYIVIVNFISAKKQKTLYVKDLLHSYKPERIAGIFCDSGLFGRMLILYCYGGICVVRYILKRELRLREQREE